VIWELETLLKQYDNNIEFDHLNNHIHCYLYIINICSSHIIASSTCISKQFFETLKSESDGDLVYSNTKGNDDDDDNNDNNNNGHLFSQKKTDISEFTLNKAQLDILDNEVWALYTDLKCDPIKCTHRIVCIVHLSDQRKQAFMNVINNGNLSG